MCPRRRRHARSAGKWLARAAWTWLLVALPSPVWAKPAGKPTTIEAPDGTGTTSDHGSALDGVAFVFVKGKGVVRVDQEATLAVMPTTGEIRDLQLDPQGGLWISLQGTGVFRYCDGKTTRLGTDSYARLAVRAAKDVWAINDSHGSVVHYEGDHWKTVRTRNTLSGEFSDNHLLDLATDGDSVWFSGWNGLWRVTSGHWTRVDAPAPPAERGAPNVDVAATYPMALLPSPRGLVACYTFGCFAPDGKAWRPISWPVDKARLASVGRALAGISADGRTVMVKGRDSAQAPAASEVMPASGINDLAIDQGGRIWVAVEDRIILLDGNGRTVQRWRIDNAALAGTIDRVVVAGSGPARLPAK